MVPLRRTEKDSKNTLYGAEVLQLYYRAKVDEMRVEWEKDQGKKFGGGGRPDNIVNAPDLTSLPADGTVYVPSWGHGFDPKSSQR